MNLLCLPVFSGDGGCVRLRTVLMLGALLFGASCTRQSEPPPAARPATPPPTERKVFVTGREAGTEAYEDRETASLPSSEAPQPAVAQRPVAAQGPERGMWVWHLDCYATPAERDRLLAFCRKEGITRLLVQIHYEIDRESGTVRRLKRPEDFAALIRQAREAGISVEALEGDPKWALRSAQQSFWSRFNAFLAWHDSQPPESRVAGLHLDIEPYLLPEFKNEEKPRLMKEYLELLTEVRAPLKERGLLLASDIPFWYDTREKDEPDHHILSFNGKEQYLNRHIQDICDYVAVMSYRQHAVGGNSITSTCQGEVDYAATVGKKAFASVEMSPISDTPQISFYGTDPSLFQEQLGLVLSTLASQESFAGVMIHHYKSFRDYAGEEKSP